jgi:hypothetical protein
VLAVVAVAIVNRLQRRGRGPARQDDGKTIYPLW